METDRPDGRDEHLFNWAIGISCLIIGLAVVFMVAVSAIRHERGWTPLLMVGAAWLIFVLIGLGIGSIGKALDRSWAKRLNSFTTVGTVVGIAVIVIGGLIYQMIVHRHEHEGVQYGLAVGMAVVWIAMGAFLYIGERLRGTPGDDITASPAIIVLWPILLAANWIPGLIALLIPLAILSGVIYVLFRLGPRYSLPLLAVAWVVMIVYFVRRRRR